MCWTFNLLETNLSYGSNLYQSYYGLSRTDRAVSILEQLVKVSPTWSQAKDLLSQLKK